MRRARLSLWVLLVGSGAMGQTTLSNETLVNTAFVVNKVSSTAKCLETGCVAKAPMFAPLSITCPAAMGATCTLHISLDSKLSLADGCVGSCTVRAPESFFQFLIDGKAPTIGPTDESGDYIFAWNLITAGDISHGPLIRQSYPASVLAGVTNSGSESHTITVNIGCRETNGDSGCEAIARWTTMRVDVFEP
jgi:hypothetical protein